MASINPSGRQQRVLLFGGREKRVREATFSCLWLLILEPQNIPSRPFLGLWKLKYLKGLAEACSSTVTGNKIEAGALGEKSLWSLWCLVSQLCLGVYHYNEERFNLAYFVLCLEIFLGSPHFRLTSSKLRSQWEKEIFLCLLHSFFLSSSILPVLFGFCGTWNSFSFSVAAHYRFKHFTVPILILFTPPYLPKKYFLFLYSFRCALVRVPYICSSKVP